MTMTHPTTIAAEPGLPFVDINREFDAPPRAVFRAHTERDLYARWLGPAAVPIELNEFEPKRGGPWRYTFTGEGDMVFSFYGVFHTVEPDSLIVQTFEFNLAPGEVGVTLTRFEDLNGRTRLSVREVYPSVATRDAAMASGMESGIVEGYDRLEALLVQ